MNYRRNYHRHGFLFRGLDNRIIAVRKTEYVYDTKVSKIVIYKIDQTSVDANSLKGSQGALDLNLQAAAALEQHRV